MPYIPLEERETLDPLVDELAGEIETSGQFTYVVYRLLLQVVDAFGASYKTFALFTGCLDLTKQEFYTRVVRPYEKKKRKQNGEMVL